MKQLAQKIAILAGTAMAGVITGYLIPQLFDRDVGGALASAILMIAGLIIGLAVGAFIIRRHFD